MSINLQPDVLIWCVVPYLNDKEKRSLMMTCERMKIIVDKHCLLNNESIEDLCQRGELLIIYKRNLIVTDSETLKIICEKGYINLLKKSVGIPCFGEKSLNAGLKSACRCGQSKIVNYIVEHLKKKKWSIDWSLGIGYACYGGHHEIMDMMITLLDNKEIIDWRHAMARACNAGHREIMNIIISRLPVDDDDCLNVGLFGACQGGHQDIIDLLITLLADKKNAKWDFGFLGACNGGHRKIIDQMISVLESKNIAPNWNEGLIEACRTGQFEIMKLAIEMGASNIWDCFKLSFREKQSKVVVWLITHLKDKINPEGWNIILLRTCYMGDCEIFELVKNTAPCVNWNMGMRGACNGGHREIVKMIIPLITDDKCWNEGLALACQWRHDDIAALMIKNGATKCEYCGNSMESHL